LPNLLTYELFKNAKEMHKKDYHNIFNSYNDDIKWLIRLLDQNVHKTKDKVVKGHHACAIVPHKV